MKTSDQIDQIATALAAAQGEIQNPTKNREVTVRSDKGAYHFAYATLDAILEGVRPILSKHKLCIAQVVEPAADNRPALTTRLLHGSGQWIETTLPISIERPGNQAFGSAMTYARRYGIVALLALAAEEDDDANTADGNHAEGRDRHPQRAAPAPARPAPSTAPAAQANAVRPPPSDLQKAWERAKAVDAKVAWACLLKAADTPDLKALSDVPADRVAVCIRDLDILAGVAA